MIVFPNCKINLGLHILRKRTDGFHDLETVFYPIDINDALEVIHDEMASPITFSISGVQLDIAASDNICVKAYSLIKKDFPLLPPVKMHLHKSIPSGAGLGGGSADGAFALSLLNQKFQLQITEDQLLKYALQLGSDCPFFIKNKPCIGTGRGENLEPLALDLSFYSIIVINPQLHINTGWAFSQLNPYSDRVSLKEIISLPIGEWKHLLKNDFEEPIFKKYPEIAIIKEQLYNQGAFYAAMSGSGSTVFGIMEKGQNPSLSLPDHYYIKQVN